MNFPLIRSARSPWNPLKEEWFHFEEFQLLGADYHEGTFSMNPHLLFSPRSQFLLHMKQFFQLSYKVQRKEEELQAADESGRGSSEGVELSRCSVTLSCVGVGYSNINKGIM